MIYTTHLHCEKLQKLSRFVFKWNLFSLYQMKCIVCGVSPSDECILVIISVWWFISCTQFECKWWGSVQKCLFQMCWSVINCYADEIPLHDCLWFRYSYTALSPLCPDVELHSKIEGCQYDLSWPRNWKLWYDYDGIIKVAVNETAECYVPDCSEKSFVWDWDIQWQKAKAWVGIFWLLLFVCGVPCLMLMMILGFVLVTMMIPSRSAPPDHARTNTSEDSKLWLHIDPNCNVMHSK